MADAGGRLDVGLGENVPLGFGDLGALAEGPGGAGEGADGDAVELAAELRPGGVAGVLGDAGQQQRQPAQDDVGADALCLVAVDRAQVDDLLEVAPAAFDRHKLLLAQGDILGARLGVPSSGAGTCPPGSPRP